MLKGSFNATTTEELMALIAESPIAKGTMQCPICQKSGLHPHSGEEVYAYHKKTKALHEQQIAEKSIEG